MYRIISIDLDGTLLTPESKVTDYTKEIINKLIEKNYYIIFSSGRHYIDIIKIQDDLKIKTFIIASNGARIYDLNRKIMFKNNLDTDISIELCKIKYSDKDIITQVYCDKKWYINNNKVDNNFCAKLSSLQYKHLNPHSLKYTNISKIFFTSHNIKKLILLEKNIVNRWKNKISASFSVPGCLEVVSGNTSKGKGLKIIANFLGLSLKNCISFGDGMNDQDMLSVSGKGCIMKNGDARLKTLLPHIEIIGDNANNGVAIFLYNMFLKNK